MNIERIREIMDETAYPESKSVAAALSQVWNECQQENNIRIEELEWKLTDARDRLEHARMQILELESELSEERT